MGGKESKPEGTGAATSKDADVVIQNLTEQKVVIREKNRQVHGPIRYELEKGAMAKVPRPPRGGTYLRHAVLIGTEEIGIISTDDLEKKQRFTIRSVLHGKYEIIGEENSEPSNTDAGTSAA